VSYNTSSGNALTYTTGIVLDTKTGERPAPTPRELLASRAIESKDGWLGQIVMFGEIVHETKPHETSADALEEVNEHIHKRFKKLITGG
jgi:hypothetical protein